MKTVCITGIAGFVGSYLARYFKALGYTVKGIDNLYRKGSGINLPILTSEGIEVILGDVRDSESIERLEPYDILIDCAAEPSVYGGLTNIDYVSHTNLAGTINCLNSAVKQKAIFILLSTSRVYSIKALSLDNDTNHIEFTDPKEWDTRIKTAWIDDYGIDEEFSTESPRTIYGTTKLASELMVQEYSNAFDLKSVINRCGVIAGRGQFGKTDQGIFTYWLLAHYFKIPLKYIGFGGEGKQVRDILKVCDLADLINMQINKPELLKGQVYNVGGGPTNSISLVELTSLAQKVTGNIVPITSDPNTDPYNVPWITMCNKQVTKDFGWKPTINHLEDTANQILDWIKTNEQTLKEIIGR